jgi:phosphate transport system protein
MNVLEKDLLKLKDTLNEMWTKTNSQILYASEALLNNNKDVANKVIMRERTIDAMELYIDELCEEIIALYSPVAVDLRFILSSLRINTNLERIADFAYGIAKFVLKIDNLNLEAELINQLRIPEMFETLREMITSAQKSFFEENVRLADVVLRKDDYLDEIKRESTHIVEKYVVETPDSIHKCLRLHGVIRKLERAGDHCVNIAEDIVFYIDAKMVKHSKLKHKTKNKTDDDGE